MSTRLEQQPGNRPNARPRPSRLRATVVAHPVATYLIITISISWAVLFPLVLNGLPPEPGLLAVVFVGQLANYSLITALEGGRVALRELFSRTFRWRVHLGWYLLAGFGLPAAITVGAVAVRGTQALHDVSTHMGVIKTFLLGFLIVPLINLWEETGWMGFVQSRLETRFGQLRAAAVTAVFFAAMHVPLFVSGSWKGFMLAVVLVPIFAVPFRIVMGWLYHHARQSVLVVAIAHAAFNASNDTPLTTTLWPHAWPTSVAGGALVVAALLIVTCSRGGYRLGRRARR
jgi:CAAX protease family protein